MTKSRKWSDISDKEKEEIKQMFMEYETVVDISKKFNVPRTTLTYHTTQKKNNWTVERELNKAQLFSKFAATKKSSFINMSNNILKVMDRAIKHLSDRDAPPTTREAKDVTVMLESLDKITRLDDGNPTEITGEKVVEFKDIEVIANMVPFKTKSKPEIVYVNEQSESGEALEEKEDEEIS